MISSNLERLKHNMYKYLTGWTGS